MPVSSFFRKVGKKASDNVVGVASGTKSIRGLDNPKFYRSIVAIGVVAFVVSGWLVFRGIIKATEFPQVATNSVTNASDVAELNALKDKDTDGDGISDYDELYNTHSSPYLKDSDGDGNTDSAEIQSGDDPNCPQGKVCEGFRLLTSITDQSGNLTPAFLRQALASAGVPQTTLDATDDASLLLLYKQAVQSQDPTNTNSASTNTNATTSSGTSLSDLQQLTPTAIRELMIKNGLDAATINAIDDETLKQIFQEAISTSNP